VFNLVNPLNEFILEAVVQQYATISQTELQNNNTTKQSFLHALGVMVFADYTLVTQNISNSSGD